MVFTMLGAALTFLEARNRTLRLPAIQGATPPVQVRTPDVVIPARPALPAAAEARPLSSVEAVRIALAQQPTLDVSRANVRNARGLATQARAGLRPTLGFSAGYSLVESLDGSAVANNGNNIGTGGTGTGGTGGTGTGGTGTGGTGTGGTGGTGTGGTGTGGTGTGSTGTNTGGTGGIDPFFPGLVGNGAGSLRTNLVLNQLIFDFNRTRDLVRQRDALVRVSENDLTTAALDLAQEVRNRFANLLQNNRLVAVSEANVRNRQSQLDLANANLQAGLGPPSDVVRAKTSLADAVSSLVVARTDEDTARVLLAESLGVDPLTPIVPSTEEPGVLDGTDPESLIATGLARRPEIVAGRENVRASEFGVSFARKTNLPSFDLSLAAGSRGNSSLFANPTATLGITLTWTFADGGLTRGRTESARAAETSARANLIRAGQLVVSEVSQAYLALANANERVTLADVGVANAQESVRLAEGRYRGGVGTFLEITDAQAALFTAQQRAETARGDVSRARANLRRAIGESVDVPRAPVTSNPDPGSANGPATFPTPPANGTPIVPPRTGG